MKLSMNLTLDGLVNAMRWQGLRHAETRPGKAARDEGSAPVGEAAGRVVERVGRKTGGGVAGDGF